MAISAGATDIIISILAMLVALSAGFSLAKLLDRLKYRTAVTNLHRLQVRLDARERALARREANLDVGYAMQAPAAAAAGDIAQA